MPCRRLFENMDRLPDARAADIASRPCFRPVMDSSGLTRRKLRQDARLRAFPP